MTFGLIVVGINVLMILFFALKFNDIQIASPNVLSPISFTEPISFP